MLTRIWKWYDGTEADMSLAVGFGRCLQTVNIIRNREEDLSRGVDFYPTGWTNKDLHCYMLHQADMADAYMAQLPPGPVREFCRIPLVLAKATLDALQSGQSKLSRAEVMELVGPGDGLDCSAQIVIPCSNTFQSPEGRISESRMNAKSRCAGE